ncbi:MAG: L-threonylcarbamoyladenylate synthase [Candidatus Gribaldobacteria bacterium]|nr:L-threonylcarbamoyladenylate synthase [Candidatus Gribaldobacteria bacterium]
MKQPDKIILKEIAMVLKNGGVGVLPTDTLYGLVGLALSKKTVQRIYKLKKRSPQKPFIILISNLNDLTKFQITLEPSFKKYLNSIWPNSVSVILDCPNLESKLSYLRPLKKTLAFRCPREKWLSNLLKQTGPLVAPSANWEGEKPAMNIKRARDYFGDQVDFYCDIGTIKSVSSTLIAIKGKDVKILRQGQVKIKNL